MEEQQKNRKIALYTFLEFTALLILTMVGSMWDWVDMRFSLSRISTVSYWNDVAIQTIMYSCALVLGDLLKLEKLELKSPDYYDLLNSYREEYLKPYKDDLFVDYVFKILNPSIKKKFLRKKYENKLARLEKFSRDSYQLEYDKVEEHLLTGGDIKDYYFKNRFTKHYYFRRKELELLKSDEYIEKHWQSMYVNYPKVNPYTFTYYLNIKINDRTMYQTENKTARDMSISVSRKVVYALLTATILGMLLINPDTNELLKQANGWIALLIKYIIRVGMICANFALGVYNAKQLFANNFLRPITNRIRMLDEYHIYKLENKWQSKKDVEAEIKRRVEETVKPILEELEREENNNKNFQNRGVA